MGDSSTSLVRVIAAGWVAAVVTHSAMADPAYILTDLGALEDGYSEAADLNNYGEVVGRSRVSSDVFHAFRYSGGAMRDLGTPSGDPALSSSANAINDTGQIVGQSSDGGFIYWFGTMLSLANDQDDYVPGEGPVITRAVDINDSGQVLYETSWEQVGIWHAGTGSAFTDGTAVALNNNGTYLYWDYFEENLYVNFDGVDRRLGSRGDNGSGGWIENNYTGVNDNDMAFGNHYESSYCSIVCHPDFGAGLLADVGAATWTYILSISFVNGINAAEVAVGSTTESLLTGRAQVSIGSSTWFLDELGDMSDWNALYTAVDVNDHGQIAGVGKTASNQWHAFLATPVDAVAAADIDPWSEDNTVRPTSDDLIPLAIYTTSVGDGDAIDFDATQVDPASLRFGPDHAPNAVAPLVTDMDGDSDMDVVFGFRTSRTGIACEDERAGFVGATYSGDLVTGLNSITTADCDGGCHP